jgi:hypothetical protein
MTNERFLIVSYFLMAGFSLLIGLGAYVWLRESFTETVTTLPWKGFASLLKRLFPIGLLFPALLGFISVSYRGCPAKEYDQILADRSYLVGKSQEQVGESFTRIAWAILAWCAVIAVLMAVKRRSGTRSRDGE